MPDDTYRMTGDPYDGATLRIGAVPYHDEPVVELRHPGSERWSAAPLRHLARVYAVGEGPWPWLRAHGVRRPSPSGTRGAPVAESARLTRAVKLRLAPAAAEDLDAVAAAWGVDRSAAVARLAAEERRR